jgi:AbrB family looped-hinge helix DNA binding protein
MNLDEGNESKVYRSKVDSSGRILLPAELRSQLGIHEGESVVLVGDGMVAHVKSVDQAIREAQEQFRKAAPSKRILSKELLQERRDEAARE